MKSSSLQHVQTLPSPTKPSDNNGIKQFDLKSRGEGEDVRTENSLGVLHRQEFREVYPEILEWISLDLTHMLETFNPKVHNKWKNLQPYKCFQSNDNLYPLEKAKKEELIPPTIVHLDEKPNGSLLGTHLLLPKPNKIPFLQSNLKQFQVIAKQIWFKMM